MYEMIRTFYSLFVCLLFLLLYPLFFYLSADTPLAKASNYELLTVIGGLIILGFALGCVISVLTQTLSKTLELNQRTKEYIVLIAVFCSNALVFLLLVENWAYSLFKVGLKTGDSFLIKLSFVAVASFLAYQFSPSLISFCNYISRRGSWFHRVLLLIFLVLVAPQVLKQIVSTDPAKLFDDVVNRYNVVVLISDGVNADEMSVYGSPYQTTPFLKAKKNEFMVFNNAFTNNQNSTGSIISLLTGMSPFTTKVVYPPDILKGGDSLKSLPRILGLMGYYRALWGVPHYVDADSQNLVEAFDNNNVRTITSIVDDVKEREVKFDDVLINLLAQHGVQRWFFNSLYKDYMGVMKDVLFIQELDNPYAQVVEDSTGSVEIKRTKINDTTRIDNLLSDIEEASSSGVPFFDMVHLMKTHGSKFRPENRVFSSGMDQNDPWIKEFYRDSILDFDDAIKVVYERLEQVGELENTILIVASDHGMRWSNKKRVPLMIRMPDSMNSGEYSVNVQLIDVAPTILEKLGADVPVWMEGQSLLYPSEIDNDRIIFSVGVSGNHVSGGVWVRSQGSNSTFKDANRFSAIYCDYFATSLYPLNLVSSDISTESKTNSCQTESLKITLAEVEELIELKLSENPN